MASKLSDTISQNKLLQQRLQVLVYGAPGDVMGECFSVYGNDFSVLWTMAVSAG